MKLHLMLTSVVSVLAFTGAHAQFVQDGSSSDTSVLSSSSGLEGFWGGYCTCGNGNVGYAVFVNLITSSNGYLVEYLSMSQSGKWRRQYQATAVQGDKFTITPLGQGHTADADIVEGRMNWVNRTNDCTFSFFRIDALPRGVVLN